MHSHPLKRKGLDASLDALRFNLGALEAASVQLSPQRSDYCNEAAAKVYRVRLQP